MCMRVQAVRRLRSLSSAGLARSSWPADFFSQEKISQDQDVHLRAAKTINRFFRAADDRLVVVERSIQDDGHAGQIAERAQQFPIKRIGGAAHGLQARGAVHVRRRGNHGALFRAHRISKGHEGRRMGLLEKFARGFLQDRRSKRPEDFAMLDAPVQDVFHFRRGADRRECCDCPARAAPIRPRPETSRQFFRRRCARAVASQQSAVRPDSAMLDAVRGDVRAIRARRESRTMRMQGPSRHAPSRTGAACPEFDGGRQTQRRRRVRHRPRPAGRRRAQKACDRKSFRLPRS